MILNMYTIKDLVANECGPIWLSKNDDLAIRQYKVFLNESKITQFLDDYLLLCLGQFDTETAYISHLVKEVNIEVELRQLHEVVV